MTSGSEVGAELGIGKTFTDPFDRVVERTEQALEREGFGILCSIDVSATMKKKLDKEFPPYRILGACYPPAAYETLTREPRVGLLLPCNVVVRRLEDGNSRVEAINAEAMMTMVPNVDLSDVAREVGKRLRSVIESI
jgi:uncharacterized protein (DUF302 family)